MALAFRAAASAQAAGNEVTVNKPTGTIDGDIMIAFIVDRYTSGAVVPVAPEGWTEIANGAAAASHKCAAFYRRASNEGASYTFTTAAGVTQTSGAILSYSGGTATGDIIDVYSNTNYTTSNTTLRAASATTTRNGAMLVFLGTAADTSTVTATAPGSFNERVDIWQNPISVYAADYILASAGASGTKDATLSETISQKHAMLVAILPAGAPTGLAISEPDPLVDDFFVTGETIDLTATATDPNGEDLVYEWTYTVGTESGDITTTDPTGSGVGDTYAWDTDGATGGYYTLSVRAQNEREEWSAAVTALVWITTVLITAPVEASSQVSGTVTLTGKPYAEAAGDLRIQWEIDTANPPSDANADYDLITSVYIAQDSAVSVYADIPHLDTWYVRARTLDSSDTASPWTVAVSFNVLEALKLIAGSQVEQSILAAANKVYVKAAKSSPAVTGTATNTTTAPTYATSPREIFISAPEGADATACAAIATSQLALRKGDKNRYSGLKVSLVDGMKLNRGEIVGLAIERLAIGVTMPIRELTFDVANDICEITVGDFWEPQTDQDALLAIAQKLQQVQKEAAS